MTFLLEWWPAIVSHMLVVLAWHVLVVGFKVPAFVMPTPLATLATLTKAHYCWLDHTWVATVEVFGGYLLAVAFGIVIVMLVTWSELLSRFVMPLLVTINMIPKIALAPLFVVWLSHGIIPNIIISFTICFFQVLLLTTARGLTEVEPDLTASSTASAARPRRCGSCTSTS